MKVLVSFLAVCACNSAGPVPDEPITNPPGDGGIGSVEDSPPPKKIVPASCDWCLDRAPTNEQCAGMCQGIVAPGESCVDAALDETGTCRLYWGFPCAHYLGVQVDFVDCYADG